MASVFEKAYVVEIPADEPEQIIVPKQSVVHDCEHYDHELECCSLLSDWTDAMPLLQPCIDGPCKHYTKAAEKCRWCSSCRTDHNLTNENDFHAGTVGMTTPKYQIMIESGNNDAPRIEFNRWNESDQMWHTIGAYYPKYCPECGRKITEWPEVHNNGSDS